MRTLAPLLLYHSAVPSTVSRQYPLGMRMRVDCAVSEAQPIWADGSEALCCLDGAACGDSSVMSLMRASMNVSEAVAALAVLHCVAC